jgi:hypothetical protein
VMDFPLPKDDTCFIFNLVGFTLLIFVHDSLTFCTIDLHELCMEQDIEIFAVKINFSPTLIYVICIYRSPTGNFIHFIECIDTTLNQLSKQILRLYVVIYVVWL